MRTKLALFVIPLALSLAPLGAHAQVRYVEGVRAGVAPPPMREEVMGVAPSQRHVWIPGFWRWGGREHMWVPGHWALPPGPGYVWEAARWENVNGAPTFFEGHWRVQEVVADPMQVYQPPPPPVQEVVVETPPPAPIVEVRPALPFAGAIWIPGFWHWSGGRHVWVGGRWTARPAGHRWEEPRWDRRPDGRWVHRPGFWRAE